jgi:hypothetical protein
MHKDERAHAHTDIERERERERELFAILQLQVSSRSRIGKCLPRTSPRHFLPSSPFRSATTCMSATHVRESARARERERETFHAGKKKINKGLGQSEAIGILWHEAVSHSMPVGRLACYAPVSRLYIYVERERERY